MLKNCADVVVEGGGVAIDYDPLPFFQATAVAAAVATRSGFSVQVRA